MRNSKTADSSFLDMSFFRLTDFMSILFLAGYAITILA
jgi:hypothetical protein